MCSFLYLAILASLYLFRIIKCFILYICKIRNAEIQTSKNVKYQICKYVCI